MEYAGAAIAILTDRQLSLLDDPNILQFSVMTLVGIVILFFLFLFVFKAPITLNRYPKENKPQYEEGKKMNWINAVAALNNGDRILDSKGTAIWYDRQHKQYLHIYKDGSAKREESVSLSAREEYIPIVSVPYLSPDDREAVRWILESGFTHIYRTKKGKTFLINNYSYDKPTDVTRLPKLSGLGNWITVEPLDLVELNSRLEDADHWQSLGYLKDGEDHEQP